VIFLHDFPLKGRGSLPEFLDLTPHCQFDSLLHDAPGSQTSPQHNAAGSQILPLHFAAGSQMQRGVKSMNVAEIFLLHDAIGSQFQLPFAAGSQISPLHYSMQRGVKFRRYTLQRGVKSFQLHDAAASKIL
jgi:hypothetical protein